MHTCTWPLCVGMDASGMRALSGWLTLARAGSEYGRAGAEWEEARWGEAGWGEVGRGEVGGVRRGGGEAGDAGGRVGGPVGVAMGDKRPCISVCSIRALFSAPV